MQDLSSGKVSRKDPDPLNITSPYKTLLKVSSSTFSPGDIIFFHAGDTFIGQLSMNSSGISGLPILFGSYGIGLKPIINGSTATGGDYLSAVYINNQQFIELKDLDIRNNRNISRSGISDSTGYGIYIFNNGTSNMNHFRFIHLIIQDVFSLLPGLEGDGIYFATKKIRPERHSKLMM